MAVTALAAFVQQTVALPGEAITAILVKKLARQLLGLDREIKDTDKLIAERFRPHPQAHIIESLPGMGPLLGARFLVATGGNVQAAFTHSGRLASYAGLAPVPCDSGRVTGNNRRPKRFNRPLRQVFYMAALSSIRADGLSRAFYQRKREENKLHTQAVLALARRLVDVLWVLLRDNRVFRRSLHSGSRLSPLDVVIEIPSGDEPLISDVRQTGSSPGALRSDWRARAAAVPAWRKRRIDPKTRRSYEAHTRALLHPLSG